VGADRASLAEVLVDRPGHGVLRLTLNRPQTMNAYTTEMAIAARDAFVRAASDDDVRVVVLTGAKDAFCSGGDVVEPEVPEKVAQRRLGWWVVMSEGIHELARTMWNFDKPVIAAINGPAVAGGLALALLCDLRLASDQARLGDTSGRFGYLPDDGGAWLFPRTMGYRQALRMSWLGEVYSASRALELGLVDEVVPHADLEGRSLELATELAARAPIAVQLTKRLMRRALDLRFEESLGDAQSAVGLINDTEDVAEGVAAFRERRAPRFVGR
jgi:2-(1,2-epoxy-1,2-dihydrophenyl)acetyl-CoA isomerase